MFKIYILFFFEFLKTVLKIKKLSLYLMNFARCILFFAPRDSLVGRYSVLYSLVAPANHWSLPADYATPSVLLFAFVLSLWDYRMPVYKPGGYVWRQSKEGYPFSDVSVKWAWFWDFNATLKPPTSCSSTVESSVLSTHCDHTTTNPDKKGK